MNNLEKYENVFLQSFAIEKENFSTDLKYNEISQWDSIGHMEMIAALEETFNISLDTDDIIDFSSYKKGMELLSKYKISF